MHCYQSPTSQADIANPLATAVTIPAREPGSSSMGYDVSTPAQTDKQISSSTSNTASAKEMSLGQHSVCSYPAEHDYIPSGRDLSAEMSPGVNSAKMQREICLAVHHIQSHMDKHYPGKFKFTIHDDNAFKVTSEFVAPFGWWQGACYRIEFDFSQTDKNNKGPDVIVDFAPPVSHLFGTMLCLAQAIPYSACSWYWVGEEMAKYSSYNFDRVQQIMNIINFVIMDTDFFDEGSGRIFYPDPKYSIDRLHSLESGFSIDDAWSRSNADYHKLTVKNSESYEFFLDSIAAEIYKVNNKALNLESSLQFEHNEQRINELTRTNLSLSQAKLVEYRGHKFYSHESLADCIRVSPIVVEPDGDWHTYMSGKNHIEIPGEQGNPQAIHRADYFYPVLLDPQGKVSEVLSTKFNITILKDKKVSIKDSQMICSPTSSDATSDSELNIGCQEPCQDAVSAPVSNNVADNQDCYSLLTLKRQLIMKLMRQLSRSFQLTSVRYGCKELNTDEELTEVVSQLKANIKKSNILRKNTDKLACIFVKSPVDTSPFKAKKWSATLKPTKTMAKISNLSSQFELTISQETPLKTQRYRDGMQWGIQANAWLPVMDREMEEYEKLATIKFLVDFAHKTLKLPNNREAIVAGDANNIIMKSLTMTMVMALEKGKKWLPSQCFLDLIVNAINTQYEIGRFYADVKYRNLKMMFNCFTGELSRKKLKDFAFLINYVVASLAQHENLVEVDKDALIPTLMKNAFIEYLVRVLERESKDWEKFTKLELDNEQSLTLDKIIRASNTGFSVVAHQLAILHFLSSREAPLTKLEEHERETLQSRIKSVQQIVSNSTKNYYGQLFKLLLPDSSSWFQPTDFDSSDHQEMILQTTLDKFHQRKDFCSQKPSGIDKQLPTDVDNSQVPNQPFMVFAAEEHEQIHILLNNQLEKLKLRKNVHVVEHGIKKFQHSCHFCGDHYTTSKPLYETKNPTKLKRLKKGFIYRSGKPIHWDCKAERKSNTEKALRLISAIEENSYPYPQSLATKAKKAQRESFNATWSTPKKSIDCEMVSKNNGTDLS